MPAFGHLSNEALVAIQIASAESRAMNHYYLGVEHVFMGLCKLDDADLAWVMNSAEFDPQLYRRHLRKLLATGHDPAWGTQMLVTPRLTSVVLLAEHIAEHWQEPEIRPAHLLLALLVEGRSIPVRMLASLQYDTERLRDALLQRLGGSPSETQVAWTPSEAAAKLADRVPAEHPSPDGPQRTNTPLLDMYGRDLSALARAGRLRPVVGRQAEMLAVAQVLARQVKNNPLLIGEPGVGKTCVVEGLAQRAVRGDAAGLLRDKRIVEITMGTLVGGARYRGDFEQKLEGIIQEATQNPQVILFFDEIHTLIGAGSAGAGTLDAANILKPALGRGDVQCIGATTTDEYQRWFERDAALERRFEVIRVAEPTPAETLEILQGLLPSLESHHGLVITPDALQEAVRLGERYLTDRRFPDKAIDILDRACASARIESLIEREGQPPAGPVTRESVARAVSQQAGVPVGELTRADADLLIHLEETLAQRVLGQEEAVHLVALAVVAGRQLGHRHRPTAVFLFLGPTGVGKTELAKALAAALFGSERQLIRLDMSEFIERHAAMRLVGAPPSYVGYEQEGQLTGAVRRRPYSVVLLDEIEKAHPDTINLFLQVFDDGRLTDGKGRTVDFSNTIVIMTSNLGSRAMAEARNLGFVAQTDGEAEQSATARKAVRQAFPPEFINRIDEIVTFNRLGRPQLRGIIDLLLGEIQDQIAEKQLRLVVADEVRELLIEEGFSEMYGARELRRVIDRLVRKPLAQFLLRAGSRHGDVVEATRSGPVVRFAWATSDEASGAPDGD